MTLCFLSLSRDTHLSRLCKCWRCDCEAVFVYKHEEHFCHGRPHQSNTKTVWFVDSCATVLYLCHFGVPASVTLLHLSEDVHLQKTFDLVSLLEGVAIGALLPLQLRMLSWTDRCELRIIVLHVNIENMSVFSTKCIYKPGQPCTQQTFSREMGLVLSQRYEA